jgi:hypothetical protein
MKDIFDLSPNNSNGDVFHNSLGICVLENAYTDGEISTTKLAYDRLIESGRIEDAYQNYLVRKRAYETNLAWYEERGLEMDPELVESSINLINTLKATYDNLVAEATKLKEKYELMIAANEEAKLEYEKCLNPPPVVEEEEPVTQEEPDDVTIEIDETIEVDLPIVSSGSFGGGGGGFFDDVVEPEFEPMVQAEQKSNKLKQIAIITGLIGVAFILFKNKKK